MVDLLAKRKAIQASRTQKDPSSFFKRLATPSKQQYSAQQILWERFEAAMPDPDVVPDPDTLRTFAWWCASDSTGKLADRADIKTLSFNMGRFVAFYNACHAYQIPESSLVDVRTYIMDELKEELGLQNLAYPKEYANWEDIKIFLRYIVAEDSHIYKDPRTRAQLGCVTLLIAENGERLGAIVRSESYREDEAALCYKDVQLYLRPASNQDNGYEIKMSITYENRKNERNSEVNWTEHYYQRSDPAHCVIVWLLALAFLDDAFDDGIRSPADLFNMKPFGACERHIRFKKDILPIPIFRRMRSCGSALLSPYLPWSSGSVTTEAQRVFRVLGFPQRFTFYNVRRTMGNTLEHHGIGITRRKRVMGHHGDSDKVFRKAYQTHINTVDSGNIFREETPRPDKLEELSMYKKRDADILELPEEVLKQICEEDEEVKYLLSSKSDLRDQFNLIKSDPIQGCNRVTITAAFEAFNRALNRRRSYLRKDARKRFRESYFQDPVAARTQYPSAQTPKKAWRADLVDALYPENESEGSAQKAVEVLITHCSKPNTQEPKAKHSKDPPAKDPPAKVKPAKVKPAKVKPAKVKPAKVKPAKVKPAEPDMRQLAHMKDDLRLTWEEIQAQFSDFSEDALARRYRAFKAEFKANEGPVDGRPQLRIPTRPEPQYPRSRLTAEDDDLLMRLKKESRLNWADITKHFPGRTSETLRSRYKDLTRSEPRQKPYGYTPEETQLLLKLKDEGLSWLDIAKQIPGRSPDVLKHQYQWLTKNKRTSFLLEHSTPEKRKQDVCSFPGADRQSKRQRLATPPSGRQPVYISATGLAE
ncbi:uncharacterized protein PAC_05584 [Phialocephala subalpina]|uniref:Myb-like domain-containing protein n=1 Tax=Phialocephala subalpina TaxID=576137 RepID=A0A1L7WSF5_9HELO|nr:uncharacterized protein PAC_05584 [Phialocephala subalpina]